MDAHDELKPSCGPNGVDVVYEVMPTVSGTLKITLSGTYDKSVSVRSSCLDSATAELSCDAGAEPLVRRRWVYANVKYYVVVDAGKEDFVLRLNLTPCGDGTQQELEDCDDPNDTSCIGCFRCDNGGVLDPESQHCYKRIPGQGQAKDWKSARASCFAWNGDLVGISSTAEADFLKTKFDNVWSGANDLVNECSFGWINGEPWQPYWGYNEPNNLTNEDCALFSNSGEMNDINCSDHHDALCERAPGGSCGDEIVQPGEECDDARTYENMTCAGCSVQCPPGEIKDPETHHCYRFVAGADLDWNAANADCNKSGAYLAAVSSPAEVALLQPSLQSPMWIGAKRAGSFRWINSDAFCYTNWLGEPSPDNSKDCITIQTGGTWSNDDCKLKKGYICERDN